MSRKALDRDFYATSVDDSFTRRFYLRLTFIPFAAKTGTRFAKFTSLIVTFIVLATNADAPAAVVKADGFQLKLNGQPFVIKGMNYSPVPTGVAPAMVLPMASMATTLFPISPTSGSPTSIKFARRA
jgi:hypothetical protein